jgi:hypothetical protein
MFEESRQKSLFTSFSPVKSLLFLSVNIYKIVSIWFDLKFSFFKKLNNLKKFLPIMTCFLDERKKNRIESANFIIVKREQKPVIATKTEFKDGKYSIETIVPQFNEASEYRLQWIDKSYFLDELELPKNNYTHNTIWQEIGQLFRKSWQIDRKFFEQREQIKNYQEKKKIVATSNLYSKYSQKYEQIIVKLENEIETGKKIQANIHQLICDYLISIEIEEVSPMNAIAEIQSSKQKSKELNSDLEDKYNALSCDLTVYLDAIDDYSDFLES